MKLKKELQIEIQEAASQGYDVTVGHTDDKAYLEPHMIEKVFGYLDEKGGVFSVKSQEIIGSESETAPGHKEKLIEKIREDLLFDEAKMPWHLLRGSALALQPIADAHGLIIGSEQTLADGYPTMSGRLPFYDSEYMFGDDDGSLGGLKLNDAIVQSRQRFYGESADEARAKADESLQNLDRFLNAPVSQDFKEIVAYCYDSLGIRSRKQEVCKAVSEHIDRAIKNNPKKDKFVLLSVGCGTAYTILGVAADIHKKGLKSEVILLDQDPVALAAAKHLAKDMGLSGSVEIHCERIFDQYGQMLDMTKILKGRQIDVAEDTGLREYLPDVIYRNLTNAIWNHLSPGGIITTGNMNINRPQPEFLHGLMGWYPMVNMRGIAKGFELHEQSGIPKGSTKARVTRDGVYTLFFSYK